MDAEDSTERLRRLKMEAQHSGGPEKMAARRRRGAGTARERVLRLVDPGSFVELDVFVEGAVTGHGTIDGRDVYVFSQDGEVLAETLVAAFARKMVKIVDLAMKNGAPLIGLYDGGSPRATADRDPVPLGAYAELYFSNVMASGLIPQIAVVMGPCEGAAVFPPSLADITVMVKGAGHLHLGTPAGSAEAGTTGVAYEALGGARTHGELSGVAHLTADDEAQSLEMIRVLLDHLPQNNLEETIRRPRTDAPAGSEGHLAELAIPGVDTPHDVRRVITGLVDAGGFLELGPDRAKNLVVGFARLEGRAIGIVANQPTCLDGRLDAAAAAKGARFVRLCDAFNLPLLVLVDTPGFVGGPEHEHSGVIRQAAQLLYAFCEATVPKLTLVTHRAYGEGFEIMCSKHIRADFVFAWPSADVSAGAPSGALSPYEAALRGHLDDIVEPAETRTRLVAALEACASKREGRPPKKHGNIPL